MSRAKFAWLLLGPIAVITVVTVAAGAADEDRKDSNAIRIGMVSTLFRDTPEPLVAVMMQPFAALMESQTGISGQLVPGGDAFHLGQLLAEDKIQIGVFHGIEFAWARQKHPELKPLMLAVNQSRYLRALVIARRDAPVNTVADLKGKSVAFPRQSREHCHLFMDKLCQRLGQDPGQLFKPFTTPANAEEALDDVVDRKIQGAVIDAVSLECFKHRKPARYDLLKMVETSDVFPAAVVAYRPGVLDDTTLRSFRDGLIKANQNALGRQFMMLWKLTAFEPIPPDYEQTISDILKAYPHAATHCLK
jgi:ABC-type phosphate/phosphonate transport system substrate-binding protein